MANDVLYSPSGTDIAGVTAGTLGQVLTLGGIEALAPVWADVPAYTPPPPIIQAAGTNTLEPANAYTTFILTSGTAQDFATSGTLGSGDAGLVWYVKNAMPQGSGGNDIAVSENGSAIAGSTSTLHQATTNANTGMQIIYWDGSILTMY